MENVPDPNAVTPKAIQADPGGQSELFTSLPTEPSPFFFGRFGLRAGYGILVVILTVFIVSAIGSLIAIAASGQVETARSMRLYAQTHPHTHSPYHFNFVPAYVIGSDATSFLGLLGVCFLFSRGERRPLSAYGLGSYRIADFLPGAFWGIALLSALIGVLRALHLLVFDSRNIHGTAVFTYGLGWLIAFLFVGFSEEYIFRGYVQYTLMRGFWSLAERIAPVETRLTAFWIAAGFWSLLFACAHLGNGGENWFGLAQVFFAGITFSYALWRTGSLWWGIGFHMTWDWAQSFLFGVPDSGNLSVGRLFLTHPQGRPLLSGGADGPEGSIFATIALALTIVIIHFTARPGMQPALEQRPKPINQVSPVPEFG